MLEFGISGTRERFASDKFCEFAGQIADTTYTQNRYRQVKINIWNWEYHKPIKGFNIKGRKSQYNYQHY